MSWELRGSSWDSTRYASGAATILELVSSDVEPSTRLTVSKRFGQRFELVLSENLDDSELTWVIVYRPRPRYELRLSSSDGEENTLEFRHEIQLRAGLLGTAHGRSRTEGA